jgi:hypothetical protein
VTYFLVGYGYTTNDPLPGGFVPGTTYYWRIDEIEADEVTKHIGNVWSFQVPDTKAYSPSPADGAKFIDPNENLGWSIGLGAIMQTVYIGDDYDAVNNGTIAGMLVGDATTFEPGTLELNTIYYWRVETAGPTYGQIKGDVWSFKTTGPGGGIRADYYNGMNFETYRLTRTDPQINFNWPDGTSPDPLVNDDMFSVKWTGQVEAVFTETYTFYTNTDDGVRLWVDGQLIIDNWFDRQVPVERKGAIDLVGGQVYDLQMEYYENTSNAVAELLWSSPRTPKDLIPQAALLPPIRASSPNPANRATDVKVTPILTWGPGDHAASHQLYFGTDEDAVRNATTASTEYIGPRALGNESYTPGKLDWESTYYWRVDEVNNLNPDSPWVGSVWSFTTANYLAVDNFEGYNTTDKQIWAIWHDGLGYWDLDGVFHPGNGTGSGVGDEENDTSYMEETIVRPGSTMSMPYFFNNNDPTKMKYSEAKLTLSDPRDWTDGGVKALSLWFQGIPGSVGSFTDNFDGTYTMTASGEDIWDVADFPGAGDGYYHDEFHFAYRPLTGTGSIIARVDSVEDTDPWAKAGVMIRESLDPNSVHAFMCVTPTSGVSFQNRPGTGATSVSTDVAGINAPQWVKLERDITGYFTASYSDDGQNWTVVGLPENIPMGQSTFVGLAVTAHNTSATCQAEFSNVQVSVSGPWSNQDIGILSNEAERMYVAISNSNGTTGTVYYEDNDNIVTDATQIDTWTEWHIDLKDFQDQGVNLTDVNSFVIGFGTRGSTTPGGAGKMYFEDIRLYRPRYVPGKGTPLAADFSSDGVVDYRDIEMMAGDWLATDSFVAATVPSGSPVGWWKFENNTNDSAGTHHGTAIGSPGYAAGIDGQAIALDGLDDYVVVGSVGISGAAPRTIAGWAKADVVEMVDWINIFGFTGPSGDGGHFDIEHVGDTDDSTHGYYGVHIYGDEYDIIPVDLDWHHLAATYDGTTSSYYGDGVLIGSATFVIDTPDNVHMGKREDNDNYFPGSVDDVRIYNHVLSDAEIAGLVDNTPGDGQLYVRISSPANIYDDEPEGSRSVNFKDYAILADMWLDEQLWPEW